MPEGPPVLTSGAAITAAEAVIGNAVSIPGSEGPQNINNPLTANTIANVLVRGTVALAPIAATTSVAFRVRRNSIAGAVVGSIVSWVNPSAAANLTTVSIAALDSNPPPGTTYVLTAQSAGGNSVATQCVLSVNDCQ